MMGKIPRKRHCDYAIFNGTDRCIAPCHRNIDSKYMFDCLGNKNEKYNSDEAHEVPLSKSLKLEE